MQDLFLIPMMLAIVVFGYFVVKKVDRMIAENQQVITTEKRRGQCKVRIAAETPFLLDAITATLEQCSNAAPHLQFFLSSGRASRLLEKLSAEQIDILLLSESDCPQANGPYQYLALPWTGGAPAVQLHGIPVEPSQEHPSVWLVWNKRQKSKDRDRVIFALENNFSGSDAVS